MSTFNELKEKGFKFLYKKEDGQTIATNLTPVKTESGWKEYGINIQSTPVNLGCDDPTSINDSKPYDIIIDRFRYDWDESSSDFGFRPTSDDVREFVYLSKRFESIFSISNIIDEIEFTGEKHTSPGYWLAGSRIELDFEEYPSKEDVVDLLGSPFSVELLDNEEIIYFCNGFDDNKLATYGPGHVKLPYNEQIALAPIKNGNFVDSIDFDDRLSINQLNSLNEVLDEGMYLELSDVDSYQYVAFGEKIPNVLAYRIECLLANPETVYNSEDDLYIHTSFFNADGREIDGCVKCQSVDLFVSTSHQENYDDVGYMVNNYVDYPLHVLTNRFQISTRLDYYVEKINRKSPSGERINFSYISYLAEKLFGVDAVINDPESVYEKIISSYNDKKELLVCFLVYDQQRLLGTINHSDIHVHDYECESAAISIKMMEKHNHKINRTFDDGVVRREIDRESFYGDGFKLIALSDDVLHLYWEYDSDKNFHKTFVEYMEKKLFEKNRKGK